MHSAECPQRRGLLCRRFRITRLIVHHQPTELEVPEEEMPRNLYMGPGVRLNPWASSLRAGASSASASLT